jgi:hypothetical protein
MSTRRPTLSIDATKTGRLWRELSRTISPRSRVPYRAISDAPSASVRDRVTRERDAAASYTQGRRRPIAWRRGSR